MAITNLYPNLPGHLVEFKDGGLQLISSKNNTGYDKSLLILGTAFDGPVNEPVRVDEETVSQLFGPEVDEKGFPNGATLTKYAKQAFANGFGDVRCMRVTGSCAYTEIIKTVKTDEADVPASEKGIMTGNDEHKGLALTHLPVFGTSVSITTATGLGVSVSAFDTPVDYNGVFDIAANIVSKNTTLNASYAYMDIASSAETQTHDMADGDTVTLNFDPDATEPQGIYTTVKNGDGEYVTGSGAFPLTDGIAVSKADGTVFTEGTDYSVSGNILSVLPGGAITSTDVLNIEYYVYTKKQALETVTLDDSDVVISVDKEPIEGSVTVTVVHGTTKTEAPEGSFETDGKNIVLKAGEFNINDEFVINYKYKEITEATEAMTVRAIYGGSVYKAAAVSITEITDEDGNTGRKFLFTKPESKLYGTGDKPFFFTSFDCPTVGALKMALSNYAYNNVFEIVTDDENILTSDFPTFSGTLSSDGEDGVNVTANEMYEALSGKRDAEGYLVVPGAYQILENYHCNYIYPAGIYADTKQTVNKYSSFQHELALLCAVLTYRTKMTHGFIDVKPNSNTTLVGIQKYVDSLAEYKNMHYMQDMEGNDIVDKNNKKMDIGWYTSLVAGPEPVMYSDTLGTYYGSPAIAYAALCASLHPWSAPTNKPLPNVKGMKYKLSNKQMNILTGNRMVTFKIKNEGETTATSVPYCVDAMTSGAPKCDYARFSTVAIVSDVIEQIREVADPFIGEPNTIEQRNALSALISKRLSYIMEKGEVLYYAFEIQATIQQVLIGECTIDLELACPMELRRIRTTVGLRPAV